mmetsp:Transcript_43514/g.114826  ORF Transcript_43514/g.114826 Transcript_43514/m.114826 type:complete len:203 (+) Transcript_43514:76-684(+)
MTFVRRIICFDTSCWWPYWRSLVVLCSQFPATCVADRLQTVRHRGGDRHGDLPFRGTGDHARCRPTGSWDAAHRRATLIRNRCDRCRHAAHLHYSVGAAVVGQRLCRVVAVPVSSRSRHGCFFVPVGEHFADNEEVRTPASVRHCDDRGVRRFWWSARPCHGWFPVRRGWVCAALRRHGDKPGSHWSIGFPFRGDAGGEGLR